VYAIAIFRYRRTLDEVLKVIEEHRAYMRELKARGTLIASGPLDPRYGGAAIFRLPDQGSDALLIQLRDGDPYVKKGVAQWEVWNWVPGIGREDLDRL